MAMFDDISIFYDGRVIAVNVDNEENRSESRGSTGNPPPTVTGTESRTNGKESTAVISKSI